MRRFHKNNSFDLFNQPSDTAVKHWIDIHFFCVIGLTVILFLLELFGSMILSHYKLIRSPMPVYICKYILIPSGINTCVVLLCLHLKKRISNLKYQALLISFLFTFIVFVIYSFHPQFSSIEMGFAAAITITIIYGSGRITTLTAALAILLKSISDAFIVWDPTFTADRLGTFNEMLNFLFSILALLIIYGLAMSVLTIERSKHAIKGQAEQEKGQLLEQVLLDELTGIYNRNGLRKVFHQIGLQNTHQYVIAMIDMDRFKAINDSYGHSMGDRYLKAFGEVLKTYRKEGIDVCRFGGDEFCIVFQNRTYAAVLPICQAIQKDYLECELCKQVAPMTLSIGLAVCNKKIAPSAMIKMADEALYQAKQNRGSISLYQPAEKNDLPSERLEKGAS